jgi:superfamily II DNA or RNA helicase
MLIKIGNVYSTAYGKSSEMKWLEDILSIEEKIFSPYEVRKCKVKHHNFLQDGQFLSGLMDFIVREAAGDVDFEFIDARPAYDAIMAIGNIPLTLKNGTHDNITLREEQLISVRRLIEFQRGIIDVPPGGGKTEIAIAGMMAVDSSERFSFLVHTESLLKQWLTRFLIRGVKDQDIGVISNGKWMPSRITVAMAPTLSSRIDDIDTLDFLHSLTGFVADECHTSGNQTNESVLVETPNCRFRWGLSATALEYGVPRNMKTIGLIGDPLYSISMEDLIELENIADILYHFIPCPFHKMFPFKPKEDPYQELYDFYLHFNPLIPYLINQIFSEKKEPMLVIVNRVDSGKFIRDRVPGSEFIHGQSRNKEEVLSRFRKGGLDILIASPVIDFGIDLPDLRHIFLAGGMESVVRLLQRIGRGLRKKLSNNLLHVYDPDFSGIPYLGDHSQSRIDTLRERCPNLKVTSKI